MRLRKQHGRPRSQIAHVRHRQLPNRPLQPVWPVTESPAPISPSPLTRCPLRRGVRSRFESLAPFPWLTYLCFTCRAPKPFPAWPRAQ